MNKSQKIIASLWVIFLAIILICVLQPTYITGPYLPPEGVFDRYSIDYYDFGIFGGILSVVMFVLFYLWRDKHGKKKN